MMRAAAARVAILGGTFDPIHEGHLAMARHFAARLDLDELVLMPAGQPWQKQGVSPAAQRLAMTELAAQALQLGATRVQVSREEIERSGATYTVETLGHWRARLGPDASLALIVGADQLLALDTWRDWQRLFVLAHLCVAARPGFDTTRLPPALAEAVRTRACDEHVIASRPAGGILLDHELAFDVSATDIRHRLQAAARADEASCAGVPPAVCRYIRQHHLYTD